jgi:protease PrsW
MADTVIYSLLGGTLPALLWLVFWLREDSKRPEPRRLILTTFLLGMASVIIVLPFQIAVDYLLPTAIVLAFLLWAVIEEILKLGAAYFGGLRTKDDDEPIDPLIYMITAALGFTALENALFIANPLLQADIAGTIVTGNIRFIGASVLHVVSSAIIGIALGLTFYKPIKVRIIWGIIALVLATLYHTAFNLALNHEGALSNPIAFTVIWTSVVVVLLFFEKIKTIRPSLSTRASSQFSNQRDTI